MPTTTTLSVVFNAKHSKAEEREGEERRGASKVWRKSFRASRGEGGEL